MSDKMREALERLATATDKLLADMRERAIMRGDYDTEEGRKIAILDCGNGVLFNLDDARDMARAALAEQPAQGEMIPQYRRRGFTEWYDGFADHEDGGGPYQERILYTAPPAPIVPDHVLDLIGNVIDNLQDMPISDAWAAKTAAKLRAAFGFDAMLAAAPEVKP